MLSQPWRLDVEFIICTVALRAQRPRWCSALLLLPSQDIECLASDGMLLVSCCLVGQIRVWDAQTGDCLTVIPKPRYVIALRSLSSRQNPFWTKSAATVLGAASIPAIPHLCTLILAVFVAVTSLCPSQIL